MCRSSCMQVVSLETPRRLTIANSRRIPKLLLHHRKIIKSCPHINSHITHSAHTNTHTQVRAHNTHTLTCTLTHSQTHTHAHTLTHSQTQFCLRKCYGVGSPLGSISRGSNLHCKIIPGRLQRKSVCNTSCATR